MGKSRYKVVEPTHPHFMTCTILHWLPLFTNKESVQIIIDSLKHLQKSDNLTLFSYVILENHIHLIAQSDDIGKSMQKFKSYTAYELLKLLQKNNAQTLLKQLSFHKKAHRTESTYQIWEEGFHPNYRGQVIMITQPKYRKYRGQVITIGQNSYQYNEDGYLQEKVTPEGTTTYTYGTLGELISVDTPSQSVTYTHNANNQRVAKLINGQVVEKYLWANLTTLLAIYDANDNLLQRFEYAESRMPVSMTDSNGTKYYLQYDQVGSLRAVSDTNHHIIKEVTYDTYGNILEDSNEEFKVPFGFSGGLYDGDTKLTRFGYRDYDAYTGKWTAKDPIGFDGGDSNLYGYVLGDPVNFYDPSGLILENEIQWWKDFFNGTSDFLNNYSNMQNATDIIHDDGSKGWANQDKYFHCLANCQATNRGDGGYNAAITISELRELVDEYFKGNSAEDCNSDRRVNEHGRKGGNCAKRCEKFRPGGSFPY